MNNMRSNRNQQENKSNESPQLLEQQIDLLQPVARQFEPMQLIPFQHEFQLHALQHLLACQHWHVLKKYIAQVGTVGWGYIFPQLLPREPLPKAPKELSPQQQALAAEYVKNLSNPQNIFHYHRILAHHGNADAMILLGSYYDRGHFAIQDINAAMWWNCASAVRNNSLAQLKIGGFYEYGPGIKTDMFSAVEWYKLAAKNQHEVAQNKLGACYEYGNGVALDIQQAIYWYNLAAKQEILPCRAKSNLVRACYKSCGGIIKDTKDSYQAAFQAVDKDLSVLIKPKVDFVLSKYFQPMILSKAKEVNSLTKLLTEIYWLAVDMGESDVLLNLGFGYKYGIFVTQNSGEALRMFTLAKDYGHPFANQCISLLAQEQTESKASSSSNISSLASFPSVLSSNSSSSSFSSTVSSSKSSLFNSVSSTLSSSCSSSSVSESEEIYQAYENIYLVVTTYRRKGVEVNWNNLEWGQGPKRAQFFSMAYLLQALPNPLQQQVSKLIEYANEALLPLQNVAEEYSYLYEYVQALEAAYIPLAQAEALILAYKIRLTNQSSLSSPAEQTIIQFLGFLTLLKFSQVLQQQPAIIKRLQDGKDICSQIPPLKFNGDVPLKPSKSLMPLKLSPSLASKKRSISNLDFKIPSSSPMSSGTLRFSYKKDEKEKWQINIILLDGGGNSIREILETWFLEISASTLIDKKILTIEEKSFDTDSKSSSLMLTVQPPKLGMDTLRELMGYCKQQNYLIELDDEGYTHLLAEMVQIIQQDYHLHGISRRKINNNICLQTLAEIKSEQKDEKSLTACSKSKIMQNLLVESEIEVKAALKTSDKEILAGAIKDKPAFLRELYTHYITATAKLEQARASLGGVLKIQVYQGAREAAHQQFHLKLHEQLNQILYLTPLELADIEEAFLNCLRSFGRPEEITLDIFIKKFSNQVIKLQRRISNDTLRDIQIRLEELKQTITTGPYNELIQKEHDELEKLIKSIHEKYAQQDLQMEELKALAISVFTEVYNQKIIDQQALLGQSEYQFQQPLLNFTSIVQQLSLIGHQHNLNSRQLFIERINKAATKAKSIGTWKHSFFHLDKLLPGFVASALQLRMIGYPFPLIHPKLEAFQKKYLYSAKKLLIEQLQSEASTSDDIALIAEIEAKNRYLDAVHVHKLGELLGFATDVTVINGVAHFLSSKESIDLNLPVIHIQLEKQHFQFLFKRLKNSPVELINVTGDGNCGVYAVLAAIHAHILKHEKIYQQFLQRSPKKPFMSENPSTLLGKRKKQGKVIDLRGDIEQPAKNKQKRCTVRAVFS